MKWGCYWTTGTSASQHFTSTNLIKASSLSYMLPSQVMELFSEPEWLLLQILCWKARGYTHVGQAIEFWVCAQRGVCVGRLTWSRMRVFWRLQQRHTNMAKSEKSTIKKDKTRKR